MEDKKVMEIPIENIVPNPYQPRKVFSQAALEELSNSIKVYGILQPITVRQKDDKYELIAGERRFRAAKLANLQAVPAIINNMSDESSAVLALLENLQREDLNFIEEAMGYSVKIKLVENNLTERHARALLKLPTEELINEVLDKVIKNELTVKKTEKMIKDLLEELESPQDSDKKQNIKGTMGIRIYLNTMKQAFDAIIGTGIEAKYNEVDKGDYMEVVVKIPKK